MAVMISQRQIFNPAMSALRPFIPQSRTLSCVAANVEMGHNRTSRGRDDPCEICHRPISGAWYGFLSFRRA